MDPRPRRDGDLLTDPRRGIVVALVMLAVVIAMTALIATDVAAPPVLGELDRRWRDLVQPPAAWADRLSGWLYLAGSGWVMVPLRVVIGIWLAVRRRWVDLAAWLGAWVLADLLTQLLKPGVGRLRPDLADATSFPSGHAKTAAQVAIGLVLVTTSPWRSRAGAWGAAIAWIVAISISRTVLDEHYMSDVLTGSLLGAACSIGVAGSAQRMRDRRVARGAVRG